MEVNDNDEKNNKTNDIVNRVKLGEYLRNKREELKMTMVEVGKTIGFSAGYIGEIERGNRNPTDEIIRGLSKVYGIDENWLFKEYGRIPLIVREVVESEKRLQDIVIGIESGGKFNKSEKKSVYEYLHKKYLELVMNKEKDEDN